MGLQKRNVSSKNDIILKISFREFYFHRFAKTDLKILKLKSHNGQGECIDIAFSDSIHCQILRSCDRNGITRKKFRMFSLYLTVLRCVRLMWFHGNEKLILIPKLSSELEMK